MAAAILVLAHASALRADAAESATNRIAPVPPAAGVWPDAAPADCPFAKSLLVGGVAFTGRHAEYTKADTWYPSWASDGNLYSPFTDGTVDKVLCFSSPPGPGRGEGWVTGNARIEGEDPLHLKIIPLGVNKGLAAPYGGRYPCGSLVHDGVWYYGTYYLDWHKFAWDVMRPFLGFRISRDAGKTCEDPPCTPARPLFGEVLKPGDTPPIMKVGANVTTAYFVNIPSKFISPDGWTMWLCYAANWAAAGVRSDPPGARYAMCLREIRLLSPGQVEP
jgi:hypothetical protein